jgi:prolyl-tRNA synthetase
VAQFRKPSADPEEPPRPVAGVATPRTHTIGELTRLLGIPRSGIAKAVFVVATMSEEEGFVFAVVRGDMELNETKLANAVGAGALRPARKDEIRSVGAEPGYASPVGLRDVLVVADDAVVASPNLVAGANQEGFHLLNVNHGRDFEADIVADLAAAEGARPAPSAAPRCGPNVASR